MAKVQPDQGAAPALSIPMQDHTPSSGAGRRPCRRRHLLLISEIVLVAVALLIILPVELPGVPWGSRTVCSLGRTVAPETVYTPLSPVESPFHGLATSNISSFRYVFSSGGLFVQTPVTIFPGFTRESVVQNWSEGNGSVAVTSLLNVSWEIESTENISTWGSGPGSPCTAPYVADAGTINAAQLVTDLLAPWQASGNTSDRFVPYSYPHFGPNLTKWGYGSVAGLLSLRPVPVVQTTFSTCGNASVTRSSPKVVQLLGQGDVWMGIPFSISGTQHVVWGLLIMSSSSPEYPLFSYSFAGQGVWQESALGLLPSSPMAFTFSKCG